MIRIEEPIGGASVDWRTSVRGLVKPATARVVVIVRPRHTTGFWVQPIVTVEPDGHFQVLSRIGGQDGDFGNSFEIRAFANPAPPLREEQALGDWPMAEQSSATITVTRSAGHAPAAVSTKASPPKRGQHHYAVIAGIVFIIITLIIAIVIPTPTDFQYFIFRTFMALAASAFATAIPGFLEVKISTLVRATGAIAVFAIVYFLAPATLGVKKPEAKGDNQTRLPNLRAPEIIGEPTIVPGSNIIYLDPPGGNPETHDKKAKATATVRIRDEYGLETIVTGSQNYSDTHGHVSLEKAESDAKESALAAATVKIEEANSRYREKLRLDANSSK